MVNQLFVFINVTEYLIYIRKCDETSGKKKIVLNYQPKRVIFKIKNICLQSIGVGEKLNTLRNTELKSYKQTKAIAF